MIVDVHAHTSIFPMREMHTTCADVAYIRHLAAEHEVDRVVLMATYFPLKGTGLHNRELLSRIAKEELFLAFVSLDMTKDVETGLNEIEELAGNDRVVGIKLYPGYQDFDPSGKEAFEVYRLAAKLHLPVAFHAGALHHCCSAEKQNGRPLRCGFERCKLDELMYRSHPASFEGAFGKYPEVNFLVSHLAKPHFRELHDLMGRYPNVYTDFSGQFLSGSGEDTPEYRQELASEIRKFLNLPNGSERLLFGSDFPIQSYPDSFDLVRRLGLSPKESKLVLGKNAERLLNL